MITRILLLTVLILNTLLANGQDTVYYDQDRNPTDRKTASYYEVSHYDFSKHKRYVVDSYYTNGSKKGVCIYTTKSKERTELIKEWYPNGQLNMQQAFYGEWTNDTLFTFWENGNPKRVDISRNGKLVKGTCYDVTGKEMPHFDYEIMPEYPGGESKLFMEIYNNIRMPEIVKELGLAERVVARFAVDTSGNVVDIKIVEGKYPETNKEVIRVLSRLKRWRPGLQDGEPVRVSFTVPVNFEVRY